MRGRLAGSKGDGVEGELTEAINLNSKYYKMASRRAR